MTDPLTVAAAFVGKAVVKSAQDYVAQRVRLAAEAEARNEQTDTDAALQRERLRADALGQQARQEHERYLAEFHSDRDADRERSGELRRRKLEHYPIPQGPGFLRDSLNIGADESDGDRMVVLLAPPPDDASDAATSALRARVADDLRSFAGPWVRTWHVDRPLQWPNHDLYVGDLFDVSALIVQVSLAQGLLSVRLGGCNLGLNRTEDTKSVHRMAWPSAEEWTRERIELLNGSGFAGLRFPLHAPPDQETLARLNHELVSRLVVLCVVAAIDAFYLTRRSGYDELLDDAANKAGQVDLPVGAGVDERYLADPVYHYLNRVERRLRRGQRELALGDLRTAMGLVAGTSTDSQDLGEAIEGVARSGRLPDHHRCKMLEIVDRFPRARWSKRARSALLAPTETAAQIVIAPTPRTRFSTGPVQPKGEQFMKRKGDRYRALNRSELTPRSDNTEKEPL